jgi:hypothetical protein
VGGVSHPKSLILSARDWYCLPTGTEVRGHRGRVAGEVSHPKSPISSACNRYCLPTETEVGGHRGSVVGEADVVVLVLGC